MYHCAVKKSLVRHGDQAEREPTPACPGQAHASTVLTLDLTLTLILRFADRPDRGTALLMP